MVEERVIVDLETRGAAETRRELAGVTGGVDQLERELDQAGDEADRLGRELDQTGERGGRMSRVFGGLRGAVTGFVAAAAAYAGVRFGQQLLSDADELQKMGIAVGENTETLSEMRFVLEQNGASLGAFQTALRTQSRVIDEARQGSKEYADILDQIGVNYEDLEGLSPVEQFRVLAEATRQLDNDTERLAIAQQLFGRGAIELIPTIEAGADAIRSQREEARALGLTVGQEFADDAAEFNDNLHRMTGALTGLARGFLNLFLPAINAAVETVLKFTDLIGVTNVATKEQADALGLSTEQYEKYRSEVELSAEQERRLLELHREGRYSLDDLNEVRLQLINGLIAEKARADEAAIAEAEKNAETDRAIQLTADNIEHLARLSDSQLEVIGLTREMIDEKRYDIETTDELNAAAAALQDQWANTDTSEYLAAIGAVDALNEEVIDSTNDVGGALGNLQAYNNTFSTAKVRAEALAMVAALELAHARQVGDFEFSAGEAIIRAQDAARQIEALTEAGEIVAPFVAYQRGSNRRAPASGGSGGRGGAGRSRDESEVEAQLPDGATDGQRETITVNGIRVVYEFDQETGRWRRVGRESDLSQDTEGARRGLESLARSSPSETARRVAQQYLDLGNVNADALNEVLGIHDQYFRDQAQETRRQTQTLEAIRDALTRNLSRDPDNLAQAFVAALNIALQDGVITDAERSAVRPFATALDAEDLFNDLFTEQTA